MKKLFVLATMILSFSVMTLNVSAQTKTSADKSTQVQTQQTGPAMNGNCANNPNKGACNYQQCKGKTGNCDKFIDKNGDGKCDNCTGGTCSKGKCSGKGAPKGDCCGKGSGNGCGMQHHGNGPCQINKTAQPVKK